MKYTIKDKAEIALSGIFFDEFCFEIRRKFDEMPHGGIIEFKSADVASYFNSYLNATAKKNNYKSIKKGATIKKHCFDFYTKPGDFEGYYRIL